MRRNGFGHPIQGDVSGPGSASPPRVTVEVYGNTVEDNNAGITATQDDRSWDQCGFGSDAEVANLYVHDNIVRQETGIAVGLRLYKETNQAYHTSKNNRWQDNGYTLGDSATGLHFFWANARIRCGGILRPRLNAPGPSAERWRDPSGTRPRIA